MSVTKLYRNFRIYHEPPPIPLRQWDWRWIHEDYDGAPDARDDRHGCAPSEAAAIADVDAWYEDQSVMNPELENMWRDLVAEAAEQRRRAELFPDLVDALDTTLTYVTAWATWQGVPGAGHQAAIDQTTALLVRCRKPQP